MTRPGRLSDIMKSCPRLPVAFERPVSRPHGPNICSCVSEPRLRCVRMTPWLGETGSFCPVDCPTFRTWPIRAHGVDSLATLSSCFLKTGDCSERLDWIQALWWGEGGKRGAMGWRFLDGAGDLLSPPSGAHGGPRGLLVPLSVLRLLGALEVPLHAPPPGEIPHQSGPDFGRGRQAWPGPRMYH